MAGLRRRLEALEAGTEGLCAVLRLPDGGTVRYTTDEALAALHAAIRGGEDELLARFVAAGTSEGLPGLCRPLVGSREDGGVPVG